MSNEGGVQRSLVCKDEFNVENIGQIPDGCQSRPKPITRPLGGQRRDSSVSHAPTRPAVQSAIVPDASWGFLGLVETFDRPDGPLFYGSRQSTIQLQKYGVALDITNAARNRFLGFQEKPRDYDGAQIRFGLKMQ